MTDAFERCILYLFVNMLEDNMINYVLQKRFKANDFISVDLFIGGGGGGGQRTFKLKLNRISLHPLLILFSFSLRTLGFIFFRHIKMYTIAVNV